MGNNNNYIAIRLSGGLGNQMFQYAFGLAVSLEKKCRLLVDFSNLENEHILTSRRIFELGIFKDKFEELKLKLHFKKILNSRFKKFLSRENVFGPTIRFEKKFDFEKDLIEMKPPVLYIGYFQSPIYFEKYQERIRQTFQFNGSLLRVYHQIVLEQIKDRNSVGIHIRRGDYVTNKKANAFHGVLKVDYYIRALNALKNVKNDLHVYVFSDDIEWVEHHFSFDLETYYVCTGNNDPTWTDMYLMSTCKHNIIANSTYSWWAAYLNSNPEKIVIAPKKWFNDSNIYVDDLFPRSWIRI
ncbi:alpha-1,2-fucosyltransferase [Flavobacteriaceae bacterium]|nr:alpha-1,2-fucosyltransferase [Flavobacteriaceae bacterium]